MVCIVEFGDFPFFIDQERHVFKSVIGDELAVRLRPVT